MRKGTGHLKTSGSTRGKGRKAKDCGKRRDRRRKMEDGRLTTSKLRKTGGVERKEEGKRKTEDERGGLKTED